MKTNMNGLKELGMDELEQVNGGSVTVIGVIALVAGCVSLGVEAFKFGRKVYNDMKN